MRPPVYTGRNHRRAKGIHQGRRDRREKPREGELTTPRASHFDTRAVERIGIEDPDQLYSDLLKALSDPDTYGDFVEKVQSMKDGKTAWRFRVKEGIFYVIAAGKYPVTIFPQAIMRHKKWARKQRTTRPGLRISQGAA